MEDDTMQSYWNYQHEVRLPVKRAISSTSGCLSNKEFQHKKGYPNYKKEIALILQLSLKF